MVSFSWSSKSKKVYNKGVISLQLGRVSIACISPVMPNLASYTHLILQCSLHEVTCGEVSHWCLVASSGERDRESHNTPLTRPDSRPRGQMQTLDMSVSS